MCSPTWAWPPVAYPASRSIGRTAFAASVLLLVSGSVTLEQAGGWLDWDALLLLLGMMIISVQFQLSGVYARVNVGVGRLSRRPKTLLALVTVLG